MKIVEKGKSGGEAQERRDEMKIVEKGRSEGEEIRTGGEAQGGDMK